MSVIDAVIDDGVNAVDGDVDFPLVGVDVDGAVDGARVSNVTRLLGKVVVCVLPVVVVVVVVVVVLVFVPRVCVVCSDVVLALTPACQPLPVA